MDFEKVLLSRKSCRQYLDKAVEADKLEKVVIAGSLAPIGQPKMGAPALSVVTDKEMLKTLGYLMAPAVDIDICYGAPALIVVSCPPASPGIADQNAACVVEMMSLMATSLGLGNIYLYGVAAALQKNEELMKKLSIPENYTPLAALALGYGTEEVSVCKEMVNKLQVFNI